MLFHIKKKRLFAPVFVLLNLSVVFVFYIYSEQEKNISEEVLNSISMEDLIAMVFWDKGNSKSLLQELNNEKQEGLRDEELTYQS
jgi:hypothetical protein